MTDPSASDAEAYAAGYRDRLQELIDDLRRDLARVEDPKAQALFETTAEALGGLVQALQDYREKDEEAWR